MKKITLLFTFLIAFGYSTYAQVSAYSFSESTEAYAQITGTTSTATGDDGSQNTIAIGFTFNYGGTPYTTFSINTNGFIRLGNTIAGSPWTNSLGNTAAQRPLIAPFWDDNNMTGGEIRYAVTGTTPNQVLTVNWHNSKIGSTGSTAGAAVSTLLRLYETTNVIEFVYSNPYTTTNTVTASVGLNGSTSFLSVTPAASSTVSSAVANNSISSAVMANLAGKKLIFTPPVACSGTPVAGTVTPTTQTLLVGQTPAALVASGFSSGVAGLTFQWQESDDDGATDAWANAVGGTGATTASYVPPVFASSIYYRLLVTCTNSGLFANSPSVVLSPCGTLTVPSLEDFTTYLPGCWQEADNGDILAGPASFGTSDWAVDGFGNVGTTGAIKINIWSTGKNDWILSPLYSIPATGYELIFDAAATEFGSTSAPASAWESDDFVEVLVSTGTTAWTVLYTFNDGNVPSNTGSQTIIDLDAYAGQDVRFAFRAVEGATNGSADIDFSADNFEIRMSPACSAPSGLTGNNLSDSSVDLSWTATTGNYEYVLDMVATDPAGSGTAHSSETYNATSLTQLTTYYFHVRTVCAGPTYSTWSTYSFTTLATPPANNNCSAAQVLTPGGVFGDNSVVGTNVGATNSGETAPGCASYLGGDVWYQVTVPASGNLTFENNTNTTGITDTAGAVYSGTCGSLVLINCNDSASAAGDDHPLISVSGRTPGEVLYYRVWEYGNDDFGTFLVSAYDASLSSNSFNDANFMAYPNPVIDVLNLEYNSEISSVKVINLLGQEVISKNINATSTKVDMSQLNAGAYIVNVTIGDAVKTIKVVKQ